MKKIIFTLGLLFAFGVSPAQTQTENYVKTTVYTAPNQSVQNVPEGEKIEIITYYDGHSC